MCCREGGREGVREGGMEGETDGRTEVRIDGRKRAIVLTAFLRSQLK